MLDYMLRIDYTAHASNGQRRMFRNIVEIPRDPVLAANAARRTFYDNTQETLRSIRKSITSDHCVQTGTDVDCDLSIVLRLCTGSWAKQPVWSKLVPLPLSETSSPMCSTPLAYIAPQAIRLATPKHMTQTSTLPMSAGPVSVVGPALGVEAGRFLLEY